MTLSEVNVTEFSSTFSVLDVGFEYGARTFSLSPDYTSHGELQYKTGFHINYRIHMCLTAGCYNRSSW